MNNNSFIVVENLKKIFKQGGSNVEAVNGISFELPKKKFIAIKGASGSGKTTLMYLLGALEKPTSGNIFVDNIEVSKLKGREENLYRLNKIGFVFQNYYLIPTLTALENVMLPMELARKNNAEEKSKILLEKLGINKEKQMRFPTRLSGGEQQRVAIARALANDPILILADEPTGNLDSKTGKVIIEILRSLVNDGKTVIVSTHDNSIAQTADILIEMQDGKVINISGLQE